MKKCSPKRSRMASAIVCLLTAAKRPDISMSSAIQMRAEHDGPDELIAVVGARLRGGGDRSDLEKPADARDDAERDA